mmetsp:Transcript_92676/g.276382  ORF Transcript_92676/g.276382 Transcript_92676/m.276382 type:complete len:232 (+) Transcript_92676:225-920(+)
MHLDRLVVLLGGTRLPLLDREPVDLSPLLPLGVAELLRLQRGLAEVLGELLLRPSQLPEFLGMARLQGRLLLLEVCLLSLHQLLLLSQRMLLTLNQMPLLLNQLGFFHDLLPLGRPLRWMDPGALGSRGAAGGSSRRDPRLPRLAVLLRHCLAVSCSRRGLGLGVQAGPGGAQGDLPGENSQAEQQTSAQGSAARLRGLRTCSQHVPARGAPGRARACECGWASIHRMRLS